MHVYVYVYVSIHVRKYARRDNCRMSYEIKYVK